MTPENSTKKSILRAIAINGGMILIAIGILLPLISIDIKTARWIYAAGALTTLLGRIFTPYKGNSLRVRRLHHIQAWSAIFFCVGAFFMFYPGAGTTDWLAFTLAGGAIVIYSSIMIPLTQSKEAKNHKKQK